MPELRRDPVVGFWTIIATERSRRPVESQVSSKSQEVEFCPFCEGHEAHTTIEIDALREIGSKKNHPGWKVRVIESVAPILSEHAAISAYGQGMYDVMTSRGRHEIVVEHPKHRHGIHEMTQEEITDVVRVYIRRIQDLSKHEHLEYPLLFKNHGHIFGGRQIVRHTRSQIIALPILPKRVKEELQSAQAHFKRRGRCVFCDVIRQEKSDNLRIVAENDDFIAFCPYASRSPFELWLSPKQHNHDFTHMTDTNMASFSKLLGLCARKLEGLLGDPAYNMVLHTCPYPTQYRSLKWPYLESFYHWYWQITPKLTQSAGFEWGTGIHINPTPPEDAAALLRDYSVRS